MPSRVPLPQPFVDDPFSYQAGRDAGLSHKRLRGADVSHPFRGTRDPRPDESVARLCATYATQMDDRAFFSSVTAAQLMSIPLPQRLAGSRAIHVAIVSPHRGLEGVRVIGHKVQLMGGDSWTREGLILSTPARAWCELGILLSIPELVAAGDFIIHWRAPLASHVDLMDAVERYPDKRGKRKLRAALGLLNDRAESPMESQLRTILTLGGVAGLVANYPLRIGSSSYRLDLAIPGKKVAIEYQGDYHRDRAQWRRDMTRRSRIESTGWTFAEVNGDDLLDPTELVARVKALTR
jgi:very-short-patch-repair endonuclease